MMGLTAAICLGVAGGLAAALYGPAVSLPIAVLVFIGVAAGIRAVKEPGE